MKTNFRKPFLNLKISVVDIKLMKTEGTLRLRKYKGLLNLKWSVADIKLMKTEGKLRLRKYKGLLNLKISVVDVKVMKTTRKLRSRKYKGLLNLKINVVDVKLMKTKGKLRFPSLRGPEASQRGPGDFQERTPDDPNRFLGVPLGCLLGPGLPRGAGGLKETTQATQKRPPAAEARRF